MEQGMGRKICLANNKLVTKNKQTLSDLNSKLNKT